MTVISTSFHTQHISSKNFLYG